MSNIRLKKIIAKEILLLLVCFVITLASCGIVYFNNYIEIKNKTKLSKELSFNFQKKLESQEKFTSDVDTYLNGGREVVDSSVWAFEIRNESTWNMLCRKYKNDSIVEVWKKNTETIKNVGFENAEDFNKFVLDNCISENEKKDNSKAESLEYEVNELSLGSKDKIKDIGIKVFVISFTILFVLRFFYYTIKWSVITLKTK